MESLSRYQFPAVFSLSAKERHFSKNKESVKFLNEIIVPYIKKMRESKGLGKEQITLVIMDVFTGQMSSKVKILQGKNILLTNVPANMIRFYQPLNLTVNGSTKRFIAKKFNGWYSDNISEKFNLEHP